MLRAILNKSRRQQPTKPILYDHQPLNTKTIKVRRIRHAWLCCRSRDELISDVLLWTPSNGRTKAGRPARNYIQQLCEDTGCRPEHLSEAMNDREKCRERVRDIRAGRTRWWWWFEKFNYLGSSVSSTETDINTQLEKAWTALDRLSVIWKSDLTDKINSVHFKQRSCRYSSMDALYWR